MNAENQPDSQPERFPPHPDWEKAEYVPHPALTDEITRSNAAEFARPSPVLSILLATVINRSAIFALLHAEILRQCEGRSVEVLVACDAKQISIGKKRQNLIEQAKGEWVCFIDDDDWISPNYVEDILAALTKKPDCVGFEIKCTVNGSNPKLAIASMRYKQWADNRDGYDFVRSTYHKTPVLRSIALAAGFPDLRYGEDRVYAEAVMKLVKTEVFIKSILYHYRFSTAETFIKKYGFSEEPRVRRLAGGVRGPRYDFKGRKVG